jgi:peroxiredoxin (alkyl hydroperoxide reductase subunit C)
MNRIEKLRGVLLYFVGIAVVFTATAATVHGQTVDFKRNIFPVGHLKPTDSTLRVKAGDKAPNFSLPAVEGGRISPGQYLGKKNVVISFVPAAWTPVCSDQWPGYQIAKDLFDRNGATLIGITVDNIPTLYSWTRQMSSEKLWFLVASDFFPHGATASAYGVLRSDGTAERALFVVDKKGIIRYIDVHNINERPPLEDLIHALEEVNKCR